MLEKLPPIRKGGKYPEANFEIESNRDGNFTITHNQFMYRRDIDGACRLQDRRGQRQQDPNPFCVGVNDSCGVGTRCCPAAVNNCPPVVLFLIN